jgi:hypothetical protein
VYEYQKLTQEQLLLMLHNQVIIKLRRHQGKKGQQRTTTPQ